jgi:hypothetical protein
MLASAAVGFSAVNIAGGFRITHVSQGKTNLGLVVLMVAIQPHSIFGAFLEHFWSIFGAFLEHFWSIFGAFFGAFLECFGAFWSFWSFALWICFFHLDFGECHL